MTVRVVTDSTADLPARLAEELGITVVPIYVRFGDKVYRDRVDIGEDEFYQRLEQSPVHPSTSQPAPTDFASAYTTLSQETDRIVSIHLSSKVSGTYSSALQGKELAKAKCHIEVVDSRSLSMGLGLIAMAAARLARAGEGLPEITNELSEAIAHTRIFGVLDSLKYLLLGGRIGKAKALLGAALNVKPMLTMREGELLPAGLARTRARGMERLYEMVKNALNIQELAIVHSTTPGEASSFRDRIASILDMKRIHIARLGPALGVHGGPGTLLLALRDKVGNIGQEASQEQSSKKGLLRPSLRIPKLGFS